MTTSHLIGTASERSSRLLELAVAIVLLAVVVGGWFALFTIVPFEFTPPRVR